ncbi:MAG: hypothetical protein II963_08195 [Bacteroidales bacterium]|nr:hypothetical protein [Bacteroidales bacterium]
MIKRISLFILAAVALCACNDRIAGDTEAGCTATVTAELIVPQDATKTVLDGNALSWEASDSFGLTGGSALYKYNNVSGNSFTPEKPVRKADIYATYYPYDAILEHSVESFTVNVPAVQGYVENSVGSGALAMAGTTTDITKIGFKHVMCVFNVSITTLTQNTNIRSISLKSNKPLAGRAVVQTSDCAISFQEPLYEITMETPDVPVGPERAARFMVVVPPDTHTLTLTATTETGNTLTAKYKNLTLRRSTIYSVDVEKDFKPNANDPDATVNERVILLNEGNWQSNNGQVSFIENGSITNGWFRKMNPGMTIGDTPEDVLMINDELVAISVNWSNIIQYIKPTGEAVAQTEDVPNCRAMCVDGKGYLYITSYAHETALGEYYEHGYVAKVSLDDFKVKATCEVGYEPEGVAYYDGRLYIANTGGYSFSEEHGYENSVSVVDAGTMNLIRNVGIVDPETGSLIINLYGEMSQCGRFLCINSPGDYGSTPARTIIFDCADDSYTVYDFPCTYNTTTIDDKFLAVGSSYSYDTNQFTYSLKTIDPYEDIVYDGYRLPSGRFSSDAQSTFESIQNPYCVYQNPYTGHLYMCEAKSFTSAGRVYEFDTRGELINTMVCYINPGHMAALPDRCFK